MRKEKKSTEKKESRGFYLVLVGVSLFLIIFIGINTFILLKRIKHDECFLNLALFGESMIAINNETGFSFEHSNYSNEDILFIILGWCEYGDKIFKDVKNKDFLTLSKTEIEKLPKLTKPRFFISFPKCPKGGKYIFIPSKNRKGLFDIKCMVHGTLCLPAPKEKHYSYDGDRSIFIGEVTPLGWESKFEFPKENNVVNDKILIINTTKEDTAEDKITSNSLEKK